MCNTYYGPDTEISMYPMATEERREALGCYTWCSTCMYAIAAGFDYGDKHPIRCMLHQEKKEATK